MLRDEIIEKFFNTPLKTERTLIRLMTDPDVEEFFINTVIEYAFGDVELSEIVVRNCRKELSNKRRVFFGIRLLDDDEYIGHINITCYDKYNIVDLNLLEKYRSQGYGYEVCRNFIDFLFENTAATNVRFRCLSDREGAIRLANKLGAVVYEVLDVKEELKKKYSDEEVATFVLGPDHIIYKIEKDN